MHSHQAEFVLRLYTRRSGYFGHYELKLYNPTRTFLT